MAQGNRIALAGIEGMVRDGCWVRRCGGPHYGDHQRGDPDYVTPRNK